MVRDFNYQAWQYLSSVWNGWGAAPWSADGKRCTLADKPMVDALSFIHDAIFTKKAMPGPGQNVDFFAGDAAMTITQISRASLLPKDKRFDWDLVPLPKGPVGRLRDRRPGRHRRAARRARTRPRRPPSSPT